jgi:hypothetical protein
MVSKRRTCREFFLEDFGAVEETICARAAALSGGAAGTIFPPQPGRGRDGSPSRFKGSAPASCRRSGATRTACAAARRAGAENYITLLPRVALRPRTRCSSVKW